MSNSILGLIIKNNLKREKSRRVRTKNGIIWDYLFVGACTVTCIVHSVVSTGIWTEVYVAKQIEIPMLKLNRGDKGRQKTGKWVLDWRMKRAYTTKQDYTNTFKS